MPFQRLLGSIASCLGALACGDATSTTGSGVDDTDSLDGTSTAASDDGSVEQTGSVADGGSTGESPTPAGCGDGVLDKDEICDDGRDNGVYGGCATDCRSYTGCGDGVVQAAAGETCDDGEHNGEYGYCNGACDGFGPHCGDGELQEGVEECDDGNEVVGDGCNLGCYLGGQVISSWFYQVEEGTDTIGYAVGALDDGRFYAAGRRDSGTALFVAFDADESPPFYEYESQHTGAYYLSATTLPGGGVLATGTGDFLQQDVGLRVVFDVDAATQTPHHVGPFDVPSSPQLRATVLEDGGHVLCDGANYVGLAYYGAGYEEPSWSMMDNDCRAVAAGPTGVYQTWWEITGADAYTIYLRAFDHAGSLLWQTEVQQVYAPQWASALAVDSRGDLVVAGAYDSDAGEYDYRPLLRKHDQAGETVWIRNAFFTTESTWDDVTVDALDNVIVAGYRLITVRVPGDPPWEADVRRPVLRKYSADGDLVWSYQPDDWDPDAPWSAELNSVTVMPNGEVLAVGHGGAPQTAGEFGMFFVRLTP